MKSFLVVVLPIVLVTLLAGLIYMYQTGMIEEMLAQEEWTDAGKALKLSDVDSSTADGLMRARDIVRASLETQKREELDRQRMESRETKRKKRLRDSMDGWLKRTD